MCVPPCRILSQSACEGRIVCNRVSVVVQTQGANEDAHRGRVMYPLCPCVLPFSLTALVMVVVAPAHNRRYKSGAPNADRWMIRERFHRPPESCTQHHCLCGQAARHQRMAPHLPVQNYSELGPHFPAPVGIWLVKTWAWRGFCPARDVPSLRDFQLSTKNFFCR